MSKYFARTTGGSRHYSKIKLHQKGIWYDAYRFFAIQKSNLLHHYSKLKLSSLCFEWINSSKTNFAQLIYEESKAFCKEFCPFFEGRYEIALVKLKWRGSKIGFTGVFPLSWFVVIAHYHDLRMWRTYQNSMDLNIKVRKRILWKELQTFSFVVASC